MNRDTAIEMYLMLHSVLKREYTNKVFWGIIPEPMSNTNDTNICIYIERKDEYLRICIVQDYWELRACDTKKQTVSDVSPYYRRVTEVEMIIADISSLMK